MSFLENRLPNKTPTKLLTKSVTSILNEVIYQRSNYIYFREKSIFVRNLLNSFNSNNPPPLQMVKTDHFDFQDIEKLAAQSDSVKIDEWRSIEGPIHHQNTPVSWLFQSCRYLVYDRTRTFGQLIPKFGSAVFTKNCHFSGNLTKI